MSSTRRQFLKASFGASTLLSLGGRVPGFLARAAAAQSVRPAAGEKILVVVQMAGGNDGLNTVVPYADDVYQREPPHAAAYRPPGPQDRLVSRFPSPDAGIPAAIGRGAFERRPGGRLPTSQPQPRGRHAHLADGPDGSRRVRRPAGLAEPSITSTARTPPRSRPPTPARSNSRSRSCSERTIIPTIRTLGRCHAATGPVCQRREETVRCGAAGRQRPAVGFRAPRRGCGRARSRRLEAIDRARTSARAAGYPHFQFAEMCYTIAELIRADVGIRIYYTELGGPSPGGFDNHAGQLENHAALLEQLSESVAGFVHDLARDRLLDRVLLMTFSEFGRTLRENGRRGTDHGTAAPDVPGRRPVLEPVGRRDPSLTDLDAGDEMKFHVDFRQVYATVLDQWLGIDSRAVLVRCATGATPRRVGVPMGLMRSKSRRSTHQHSSIRRPPINA